MYFIILFFSTLAIFLFFDFIWIGFLAKDLYFTQLGSLLKQTNGTLTPNWYAAIGIYILFALGIIFFVLPKTNGNYLLAILWGGFFGLIVYGIYDLTNYSLLSQWPLKITLIDIIWGTFLCAATSFFALFIKNLLK